MLKSRFNVWQLMVAILVLSSCSMFRTVPRTEVTVSVDDKGYIPSTIESTPGTQINLTLQNVGSQEHQFAIKDIALELRNGEGSAMAGMNMSGMNNDMDEMPKVHLVAAPGGSSTLEFIPVARGEYEFFCILPNHMERGVLTVKSP